MGKQRAHRRHKEALDFKLSQISSVPEKDIKSEVLAKKSYFRRLSVSSTCPSCGRKFKKFTSKYTVYVRQGCGTVLKFVGQANSDEDEKGWFVIGALVRSYCCPGAWKT